MRFSIPLILASAALSTAFPLQQTPLLANDPITALSDVLTAHGLPVEHAERLHQHISSLPEKRLVRFSEEESPVEITEGEKALLTIQRKKFMDVTDEQVGLMFKGEKDAFPAKLSYKLKTLEPLFKQISQSRMKAFLTKFSSFYNRYYRSPTGKQSQQFLLGRINEIIATNSKLNISVKEFPHSWGQNSIILRFEPSSQNASDKIVILGGHQDSTNMFPFLSAPGADDDGSGTTTLVEALTILVNSSFTPSRHPVEFHWYSAEEGGLLGSQAVAQDYAKQGKRVRSMIQTDMTGYVKPGTKPVYGIITDFVDSDFTEYVKRLAAEYGDIGYTETKCGYACSDHASWSKIGAPSAFAIESTFADSNHDIHSTRDTIDHEGFSFAHIESYTRLSLAMAVEMGGWAELE